MVTVDHDERSAGALRRWFRLTDRGHRILPMKRRGQASPRQLGPHGQTDSMDDEAPSPERERPVATKRPVPQRVRKRTCHLVDSSDDLVRPFVDQPPIARTVHRLGGDQRDGRRAMRRRSRSQSTIRWPDEQAEERGDGRTRVQLVRCPARMAATTARSAATAARIERGSCRVLPTRTCRDPALPRRSTHEEPRARSSLTTTV